MVQLSQKIEEWLGTYNEFLKKLRQDGFVQTSTNAREGLANLTSSLVSKKPAIPWIQDDLVAGEEFDVPIRLYHPDPSKTLPVLLYFHGGGHMAGSITVYDSICRKLALQSSHIVISADYRLAPECPYPAGITDALTVCRNFWEVLNKRGVDYQPGLSIAGDSAGGAICATVASTLQHIEKVHIDKQILIYPSLDYTMNSQSLIDNGKGFLLEKDKIEWYFANYFQNGEDRRQASPLYMEFSANLPKSLVITAEFCPLRDEGFAYVKKLKNAGVVCKHVHFDDMIHAFMNMEDIAEDQCRKLYENAVSFLNGVF
jgi:acetyl esterase/lipase